MGAQIGLSDVTKWTQVAQVLSCHALVALSNFMQLTLGLGALSSSVAHSHPVMLNSTWAIILVDVTFNKNNAYSP